MHHCDIEEQAATIHSIDPTTLPRDQRSAFWVERIEGWRQSGLSQKDFCQQENLVMHQFTYWLHKTQSTPVQRKTSTSGFIPVDVISSTSTQLHITLPNGIVLTGITGHNLGLVQQFIQSL